MSLYRIEDDHEHEVIIQHRLVLAAKETKQAFARAELRTLTALGARHENIHTLASIIRQSREELRFLNREHCMLLK